MTEFVRVFDSKAQADRSVPKPVAESDRGRYKPLDKPALDRNGRPRRTVPKVNLAKAEAEASDKPSAAKK